MKKLLVLGLIFLISCTDNQRARKFGGTETVPLNQGERFINATWKGDELWIVVYDSSEALYKMREKSSFGLMQGEIIFKQ